MIVLANVLYIDPPSLVQHAAKPISTMSRQYPQLLERLLHATGGGLYGGFAYITSDKDRSRLHLMSIDKGSVTNGGILGGRVATIHQRMKWSLATTQSSSKYYLSSCHITHSLMHGILLLKKVKIVTTLSFLGQGFVHVA